MNDSAQNPESAQHPELAHDASRLDKVPSVPKYVPNHGKSPISIRATDVLSVPRIISGTSRGYNTVSAWFQNGCKMIQKWFQNQFQIR